MLDIAEVRTLAGQVIRDQLGTRWVDDVMAKEAVDWVGDEMIEVHVVVQPGGIEEFAKRQLFGKAIMALNDRLQDLGDTRFPSIRYTTRAAMRRKSRAKACS